MNNKLATETCVDYKINSKANEITDVRKYKSYSSVTQLGLTSGSATIVGLWNAMPNESLIFTPASEFTSTEVPNQNGSIFIMKKSNLRGRVEYYGTNAGYGDYKMYCVGTNGIPDGNWILIEGNPKLTNITLSHEGLTFASSAKVYRVGNVVTFIYDSTITVASGYTAWRIPIGNIPSGYRPPTWVIYGGTAIANGAVVGQYMWQIAGDGNAFLWFTGTGAQECKATITYVCN